MRTFNGCDCRNAVLTFNCRKAMPRAAAIANNTGVASYPTDVYVLLDTASRQARHPHCRSTLSWWKRARSHV